MDTQAPNWTSFKSSNDCFTYRLHDQRKPLCYLDLRVYRTATRLAWVSLRAKETDMKESWICVIFYTKYEIVYPVLGR